MSKRKTLASKLSKKAEDHELRTSQLHTRIEIYSTHSTLDLIDRREQLKDQLEAIVHVLDARKVEFLAARKEEMKKMDPDFRDPNFNDEEYFRAEQ